jgi:hypothetical protein
LRLFLRWDFSPFVNCTRGTKKTNTIRTGGPCRKNGPGLLSTTGRREMLNSRTKKMLMICVAGAGCLYLLAKAFNGLAKIAEAAKGAY